MKGTAFEELVNGIRQAGAIRRRKARPSRITKLAPVDVKAIRPGLGMSQSEFAQMIGVSVVRWQNWEQGRRRLEGPALALLKDISPGVALRDPGISNPRPSDPGISHPEGMPAISPGSGARIPEGCQPLVVSLRSTTG